MLGRLAAHSWAKVVVFFAATAGIALSGGCGEPPRTSRPAGHGSICTDPPPPVNEKGRAELIVQDGHSQPINQMQLSADGRVLVTAANDFTVRVWDTSTGLMLRRIKSHGGIYGLSLSADGSRLAYADKNATEARPTGVVIADLETGATRTIRPPIAGPEPGNTDHFVTAFQLSADGRMLVMAAAGISLHDASSGARLRTIDAGGMQSPMDAAAFNGDGTLLALAGGGELALVEVATGKVQRKWPQPAPDRAGDHVFELAFAGDSLVAKLAGAVHVVAGGKLPERRISGSFIQMAAVGGRLWALSRQEKTLRGIDLATGAPAATLPLAREPFRMAASGDGRTLVLAYFELEGDSIEVVDSSTLRAVRTLEGRRTSSDQLAVDPSGKRLAVGGQAMIQWSLTDGEMTWRTPEQQIHRADALAYDAPGAQLASIEAASWIRVRDASTGAVLREWRSDGIAYPKVAVFAQGTSNLIVASSRGVIQQWDLSGPLPPAPPRPALGIHDLQKPAASPPVDPGLRWEVRRGVMSPDGEWLALDGDDGHMMVEQRAALAVVNVKTGAVRWQSVTKTPPSRWIGFSPEGDHLLVSCVEFDLDHPENPVVPALRVLDARTGQLLRTVRPGTAGPMAARGSTIAVGGSDPALLDSRSLDVRARVAMRDVTVKAVVAHPTLDAFLFGGDGGATMLVSAGGSPRGIRTAPGEVIAMLIATAGGEYVSVTPEGAYRASLDGARAVAWAFSPPLEGFSFDQFAARFERPDLLARKLTGEPVPAPAKVGRPPLVVVDRARHPATTAQPSFTVRASVASSRRVERVRVFVNGRQAAERAVCAEKADVDVEVPLPPGRSRLTVVAYDADGYSSNPQRLDVVSTATTKRPDLWVIAAGVSRYPELSPDHQLDVADDDARAIAEALGRQAGPGRPFARVHTTTLLDAQVTVESVERALAQLAGMGREDLAIVFLAGHGVRLKDGKMVFLTSLAGPRSESARKNGVGWERVHEALGRAPGRVILLLDACHSGHISTERVAPNEALAKDLAAQDRAGILVFAASRGSQLSYEVAGSVGAASERKTGSRGLEIAWQGRLPRDAGSLPAGHGLFTSAVLEALAGRAPDRDKSGALEVSELVDYVTERVRGASNGKQTPWVARREMFGDFMVASTL